MSGMVLDNDVLLKMAAWSLAAEVAAALTHRGGPSVLEVTAIVVARQLQRSKRIINKEAAASALSALLGSCQHLEPTPDEVELAADLETHAQDHGVPLDSGESLMAAVAASRVAAFFLTGDKRAIEALAGIADALGLTARIAGKVACLEQLVATIGHLRQPLELQTQVCAEACADVAMGTIFRCRSQIAIDAEALAEGLQSHIEDVRTRAPALLLPGHLV